MIFPRLLIYKFLRFNSLDALVESFLLYSGLNYIEYFMLARNRQYWAPQIENHVRPYPVWCTIKDHPFIRNASTQPNKGYNLGQMFFI